MNTWSKANAASPFGKAFGRMLEHASLKHTNIGQVLYYSFSEREEKDGVSMLSKCDQVTLLLALCKHAKALVRSSERSHPYLSAAVPCSSVWCSKYVADPTQM